MPSIYELELRRVRRLDHLEPHIDQHRIGSSASAAPLLRAVLGDRPTEAVAVLHVTAKNRVTGYEIVSVGGVRHSMVDVASVFRGAIVGAAAAIIVGHNHPSGSPEPSEDDDVITRRLREVGKALDVPMLDHIIVGDLSHYSYLDSRRGLLV